MQSYLFYVFSQIHGDAGAAGSSSNHDSVADPDADLLLSQVEVSHKCPLTQKLLEDPVSHRTCKHTYSRQAILDYIHGRAKNGKAARCPVSGCKNKVTEGDLQRNHALQGQLQRQKRRLL